MEKAWQKERSLMTKITNILERWQNDKSKLLNVASSLSRKIAMKKLKKWCTGRLQKLRKNVLKKIPKVEVPEKRQKKMLKKIKWKTHCKGVLPQITTIRSLKKLSRRWLLKLKESDVPRTLIKPKRLRNWSKRWLKIIQKKVISQKEISTQIVRKFVKYHQKESSKCKNETYVALEKTELVIQGTWLKIISGCPKLEKKIANPLAASIELLEHAAEWLDENHNDLIRDMEEGKDILIEGWPAKQVLGLIYQTVNCRNFSKRQYFTFVLRPTGHNGYYLRIRLRANPTPYQPGNGQISLQLSEYSSFVSRTYDRAVDELKSCQINGPTLAEALCALFRSCGDASIHHDIIHNIYFLLLFEIGRRMVMKTDKRPQAKLYDSLPVAVTIVKIIDLLQREILSPAEVFLDGSMYNIFKGQPRERRTRMWNIEKIYRQNQEKQSQSVDYIEWLENEFNPKVCLQENAKNKMK